MSPVQPEWSYLSSIETPGVAARFTAFSLRRKYTQRTRHGGHAIADRQLQIAPRFAIEFGFEQVALAAREFDTHRAAQRHHAPHVDNDAFAMPGRLAIQLQIVRAHISERR